MAFRAQQLYHRPWAQGLNPSRVDDIMRGTREVLAPGTSVQRLEELVAGLGAQEHLIINKPRQQLLPLDENGFEMSPEFFLHDGKTLSLRKHTKSGLLLDGDPQQMLADLLERYKGQPKVVSSRGWSWPPYMSNIRRVVPWVQHKTGWDMAAAIYQHQVAVKIQEPREGKSAVYVPSRSWQEGMPQDLKTTRVRFYNLPTGQDASSRWSLLSHRSHGEQQSFVNIGEESKLEQVVFQAPEIAAYIHRGLAMVYEDRTRADAPKTRGLSPLQVLVFPPPSASFDDEWERLDRTLVRTTRDNRYVRTRHLNQAEKSVLLSAYLHRVGAEAFDYSSRGAFDTAFVTAHLR